MWGKIMPTIHTPRFTFFTLAVTHTHTHTHTQLTAPSISTVSFCVLFADFFPCSLQYSVFTPSPRFHQLQPYLSSVPLSPASLLPPSIPLSFLWCCVVDQQPGERQVQECRPNLPASPPKLHGTVPITLWPTKAFPGLALVTRAPPLLWLQGVSLDACFTATPRTCPPAASTPREAGLQRSNNFAEPDG